MHLDNLFGLFEASPTIRLLKSDHAPYVIGFLHDVFKTGGAVSLGHAELKTQLFVYIEKLSDIMPDVMQGSPDRYLTNWADSGWLGRYLDADSSEPQYQLTRFSEDAIQFVDMILSRPTSMIGTEGRMRLVIETLTDLVRGSSTDPKRRIEHLETEQQRIEQELESLRRGVPVNVYNPVQIREQFQIAVDLLRALQGDFRAVEERFHEIAQSVQKSQQRATESRGEILGQALDAEELLKKEDEGISFYAFIAFLFSPESQTNLRSTIQSVTKLEEVRDQREALDRLRRMLPSLLQEADKVLRTNGKLTSSLKRLLDAESAEHRKLTAEVLREIRQLASAMRDDPPHNRIETSIQTTSGVASPFARTFWKTPQSFEDSQPSEFVLDLEQATHAGQLLAGLHRLDFEKLRTNVLEATGTRDGLSMQQLVDLFPPESGILELVGYFQIAFEDDHIIDRGLMETISLHDKSSGRDIQVRVPHVRFLKEDDLAVTEATTS